MPKFAANLTMMFNEVPFLERFGAAAKAGFRGVEFLFPYAVDASELARLLQAHGLQNVLFNLPPGDWAAGERGLASLPAREAEFRAGVEQAIRYARALGTPCLHAMAGLLPAGASRDAHRAVYLDNLRFAAQALAQHGLTLLIEPINPRDMPGYFLTTPDDALAICRELDEPNLQVQFDVYHAQIVCGDLSTRLHRDLARIGHIQIASVPDRHEPDDGEVNYPYLFRQLDAWGYAGWIGCEYRPAATTQDGLGWLHRWLAQQQAQADAPGRADH